MHIFKTAISNEQNNEISPQVEHMGVDYRWDDPDSVTHIIANAPLTVTPNMGLFHLDPGTNLTDIVSQGYIYTMGLLASEAFVAVLRGLVVQAHERYEAKVAYRGVTYRYRWLHMIEALEGRIDYGGSQFIVRKPGGAREPVTISDPNALRQLCLDLVNTVNGGELQPERLVFLPGTPHYDLFGLRLSNHVYFVSDELAARLIKQGLTGFELARIDVAFA
jgi:hypothetical protein